MKKEQSVLFTQELWDTIDQLRVLMLEKQVNTNKENNFLKNKEIYDLTRFTHLDYPNELACIVWFSGCNMRCQYCYNDDIVFNKEGNYSYDEVLDFLKKRVGLLDGVVLSGGEATSKNLIEFCQQIKKLGFLIKLDTNGINYNKIKELIELNLLDYIALDYKATQQKFEKITASNKFGEFNKTLLYLVEQKFNFEVRTTLHSDLLNSEDINTIIEDLHKKGYKNTFYIQRFVDTQTNIGNIHSEVTKFVKNDIRSDLLDVIYR